MCSKCTFKDLTVSDIQNDPEYFYCNDPVIGVTINTISCRNKHHLLLIANFRLMSNYTPSSFSVCKHWSYCSLLMCSKCKSKDLKMSDIQNDPEYFVLLW